MPMWVHAIDSESGIHAPQEMSCMSIEHDMGGVVLVNRYGRITLGCGCAYVKGSIQ